MYHGLPAGTGWKMGKDQIPGGVLYVRSKVGTTVKVISESCSVMSDSCDPHGLYSPWNSPGQNTSVSSLSLLQRIFPIQGSNPGLPHCRQILYQLSYQGSPHLSWSGIVGSSDSSISSQGATILFSVVSVPIYIPTNSVVFSTSPLAFIVCRFFDDCHFD